MATISQQKGALARGAPCRPSVKRAVRVQAIASQPRVVVSNNGASSLTTAADWSPESWRQRKAHQASHGVTGVAICIRRGHYNDQCIKLRQNIQRSTFVVGIHNSSSSSQNMQRHQPDPRSSNPILSRKMVSTCTANEVLLGDALLSGRQLLSTAGSRVTPPQGRLRTAVQYSSSVTFSVECLPPMHGTQCHHHT